MEKSNRFDNKSRGKKVRLTAADIHAIDFRPYPFLPLPYICALRGIKLATYKDRFTDLRRELKVVDCPPDSFQVANARYKPFTYRLTPRGVKLVLAKYGEKPRYHQLDNLRHDMISCLFVASMEIGAKEEQMPFVIWDKMKKLYRLNDYRVPTDFKNDKGEPVMLEPDWSPIGVGEVPFFFLIEADNGTETIRSSKWQYVSLERKFRGFITFFARRQHHSLKMKECFVIFAFINNARMLQAMELLSELTDGKGIPNFLFMSLPDFTTWENYPEPNGWALGTYQRVGHPPFNILGELHGRAEARTHSGIEAAA